MVAITAKTLAKNNESFGDRLRAVRAASGLTQSQVAERTGLHLITVSKLERGLIDPSWTTVKSLAEALGVTPDSFLGDDDQPEDFPTDGGDDEEPPTVRRTGKKK